MISQAFIAAGTINVGCPQRYRKSHRMTIMDSLETLLRKLFVQRIFAQPYFVYNIKYESDRPELYLCDKMKYIISLPFGFCVSVIHETKCRYICITNLVYWVGEKRESQSDPCAKQSFYVIAILGVAGASVYVWTDDRNWYDCVKQWQ